MRTVDLIPIKTKSLIVRYNVPLNLAPSRTGVAVTSQSLYSPSLLIRVFLMKLCLLHPQNTPCLKIRQEKTKHFCKFSAFLPLSSLKHLLCPWIRTYRFSDVRKQKLLPQKPLTGGILLAKLHLPRIIGTAGIYIKSQITFF